MPRVKWCIVLGRRHGIEVYVARVRLPGVASYESTWMSEAGARVWVAQVLQKLQTRAA